MHILGKWVRERSNSRTIRCPLVEKRTQWLECTYNFDLKLRCTQSSRSRRVSKNKLLKGTNYFKTSMRKLQFPTMLFCFSNTTRTLEESNIRSCPPPNSRCAQHVAAYNNKTNNLRTLFGLEIIVNGYQYMLTGIPVVKLVILSLIIVVVSSIHICTPLTLGMALA